MKVVRWLLVVPAAIAAWYAIFAIGIFTYSRAETLLCPRGEMISSACVNPSVRRALDAIEVFFIALSAVAVVAAAAAVAPSDRTRVAWAALCAGAVAAVCLAIATGMYVAGAAAIGSGLVTSMLITKFSNR